MSSSTMEPAALVLCTGDASEHFSANLSSDEPLRAELYSLERLEAHARSLAAYSAYSREGSGRPLLHRCERVGRILLQAHRQISEAYRRQESLGTDAEWLLDNFYIVADTIREVQTDLPRGYYQELP